MAHHKKNLTTNFSVTTLGWDWGYSSWLSHKPRTFQVSHKKEWWPTSLPVCKTCPKWWALYYLNWGELLFLKTCFLKWCNFILFELIWVLFFYLKKHLNKFPPPPLLFLSKVLAKVIFLILILFYVFLLTCLFVRFYFTQVYNYERILFLSLSLRLGVHKGMELNNYKGMEWNVFN